MNIIINAIIINLIEFHFLRQRQVRNMLPSAPPDLVMAVEVSGERGVVDIDEDLGSFRADTDVVDHFDLPYTSRHATDRSSISSAHARFQRGVPTSSGSRGQNRVNSSSIEHLHRIRSNPEDISAFDEKLVAIIWKSAKKLGLKCVDAAWTQCWNSLSYQNMSDEFLLSTSRYCGIGAAALVAVRGSSLVTTQLGHRGNKFLDQVNGLAVPVLTCTSIASSLLFICKYISNPDVSFCPIVSRATRYIQRYEIPQIVTLFSMIIAVYAWKARIELRNMQWMIKIWASRFFGGGN